MKKFGSIFIIILFFVLGVLAWNFFTAVPPQFFPLNNPQGTYVITKQCPIQGWDEAPVQNRQTYCVNYKGDGVVFNPQQSSKDFFSVTVGKTSLDLKQFEDKQVMISVGEFVNAHMQCVQNVCKDIGGEFVVLNIGEVKLIK